MNKQSKKIKWQYEMLLGEDPHSTCRICSQLGEGWAIGCSHAEFITPYEKEEDESNN